MGLVAVEGIDRAGKTSVVRRLPDRLSACRVPVHLCAERDSPLGRFLTPQELPRLSPFMKTYLFAADRAWTYEQVCEPALGRGELVIWDRYVASALVYRKVESHFHPGKVDYSLVEALNRPFPAADLTLVLDIGVATAVQRSAALGESGNYPPSFLEMVRAEYLSLRGGPVRVVDAEPPLCDVLDSVTRTVARAFPELFR